MTKQERRDTKLALRAEIKADYNKRFPRLNGKRLNFLVNQAAEILFSQGVRPVGVEKAKVEVEGA